MNQSWSFEDITKIQRQRHIAKLMNALIPTFINVVYKVETIMKLERVTKDWGNKNLINNHANLSCDPDLYYFCVY